ncbi:hypothetical protein Btru_058790, partial [Bulinus truncatus]
TVPRKLNDYLEIYRTMTSATPRLEHLKKLKTKFGGTLAHCIRSGCLNTDNDVGLYACDPDAYKTFSDLFFPIIKDYHRVNDVNHPPVSFGEKFVSLATFDLDSELVLSTCVTVSRNLEGFPFPPLMIAEKRKHLEIMSRAALTELRGELRGNYFPLTSVNIEMRQTLLSKDLMPTDTNRFLEAAGAYRQWPEGRGVYFNEAMTFVAWVNHEDHLKLMSIQPGGAFRKAYLKLFHALKHLERSGLQYVWREKLGYLTFDPAHIGTGMKVTVRIKLPHLGKTSDFEDFCKTNNFNVSPYTPQIDQDTSLERDVYELASVHNFGLTEVALIKEVSKGLKSVVEEEIK